MGRGKTYTHTHTHHVLNIETLISSGVCACVFGIQTDQLTLATWPRYVFEVPMAITHRIVYLSFINQSIIFNWSPLIDHHYPNIFTKQKKRQKIDTGEGGGKDKTAMDQNLKPVQHQMQIIKEKLV